MLRLALGYGAEQVREKACYSYTNKTSSNVGALACNKITITSLPFIARVL